MPGIRIATFNVENLFTRPDFLNGGTRPSDRRIGMVEFRDQTELRLARRVAEATISRSERQLTAQVIVDADADFVALQEVDDRAALQLFRDDFVHPLLSPRLGRALQNHVRLVHAEAERLFGVSPAAGRDKSEWLVRAMEQERRRLGPGIFYDHFDVIEGNDRRGIDLGFLSRLPPRKITHYAQFSYDDLGLWSEDIRRILEQDWKNNGAEGHPPDGREKVFRRDFVAIELEIDGRGLTVFNCHLKSNTNGGRDKAFLVRQAEVRAMVAIVRRHFPDPEAGNWIICGDFNDYVEIDGSTDIFNLRTGLRHRSSLLPLFAPPGEGLGAFDISGWIDDPLDRWTTYYPAEDIHSQLDHILISPALFAANRSRPAGMPRPDIYRRGLSWSIPRGPQRYPGVGLGEPKASDHAAMAVTLEIP